MSIKGFLFVAVLAVFVFLQSAVAGENELESWYTYWGLGVVDNTYPDESEFEDLSGLEHTALAMDMFGFYWPINQRTLVGGIVNSSVDSYKIDVIFASLEASVYNFLYSASAMHFLMHEIGRGPFVRADAGLALHRIETKGGILGEEEERGEWTSEWGTGFLLGGGYGIPVTSGTRLLINANVSVRRVEGEQTTSIGLTLNGLF